MELPGVISRLYVRNSTKSSDIFRTPLNKNQISILQQLLSDSSWTRFKQLTKSSEVLDISRKLLDINQSLQLISLPPNMTILWLTGRPDTEMPVTFWMSISCNTLNNLRGIGSKVSSILFHDHPQFQAYNCHLLPYWLMRTVCNICAWHL